MNRHIPGLGDRRIAGQPELRHESRYDAKEAGPIEIFRFHQVVETIGSDRRIRPRDFNDNRTF